MNKESMREGVLKACVTLLSGSQPSDPYKNVFGRTRVDLEIEGRLYAGIGANAEEAYWDLILEMAKVKEGQREEGVFTHPLFDEDDDDD